MADEQEPLEFFCHNCMIYPRNNVLVMQDGPHCPQCKEKLDTEIIGANRDEEDS